MSRAALGLLIIALALAAFGWWGRSTPAGNRRFDEMAGIIPELSYWSGWALGAIAILWLLVSAYRNDAAV